MIDKRLTMRLTNHWKSLRGGLVLPHWEHFDIAKFNDIWQQCCGWSVKPGDVNTILFTYEHVGNSIKQAVGSDLTGKVFSSLLQGFPGPRVKAVVRNELTEGMFADHFRNFPAARIVQKIDKVIKKLSPVIEEGRFTDEHNRVVRYRSCLLPFGKEDTVTNIVLGLSWKSY